jgi:photosystem II stability/assembly factor-like uncharacterized protein
MRIAAMAVIALCAASARSQEFLDTAGRWKSLTLPQGGQQVAPRAMVALRGHVVIGREERGMLVSNDSGENWRSVGGELPPAIQTVWALGYPDSAATPDRILGVAATAATPALARLIESTDGGSTWADRGALAELDPLFTVPVDTMRLYGPPGILFAPNQGAPGSTGFLYSAAGLLASTDGGATWARRGPRVAIRAMAMADAMNGIAALGEYRSGTVLSSVPGGICWTSDGGATWTQSYEFSDGGFFQHLGLRAFSPSVYRAFVPERFQNYMDWRLLRSSDGGRSWGVYLGRQSRRPLYGPAFWRDTSDVHVVSDGAILQHAADGGELFYLLRDTTNGYWQTPLDLIPGYVTRAPIAASDGRYLYFTVPGNRAARWRMASIEPFSGITAETSAGERSRIVPHPIVGSSTLVAAERLGTIEEIVVVDALGRVRLRPAPDASLRAASIDAEDLPPGRYLAVVRGSRGEERVPFIVVE